MYYHCYVASYFSTCSVITIALYKMLYSTFDNTIRYQSDTKDMHSLLVINNTLNNEFNLNNH